MKATGIIRRVDDLGRVVIPKDIRRQLGICEGEPLEIFVDTWARQPMVCFAKYEVNMKNDAVALRNRCADFVDRDNPNRLEILSTLDKLVKLLDE